MSRAKSERGTTVLIGASHAQPPSTSVLPSAPRTVRRADLMPMAPPPLSGGGVGECQERVEERVRAALDRLPVAHLVHAVTAPAQRRDEDQDRKSVV